MDWLKNNEAGGGAYQVDRWTPGQELTYRRFDGWKSGPLPKIQRVIWRTVPSAGNRRALLERGDADISFDLPPKDVSELAEEGKLTVIGTPIDCCIPYIDMNVKMPPFDNVKVRQAVAYAIPYQKIMDAAMFGRGNRDVRRAGQGHRRRTGRSRAPYVTDLAKAKQLLAEAGMPDGFETTLSFDLGVAVTNEPICELVQESLAQIGVKLSLNKVPGANWRAEFAKKTYPFVVNVFGAWLTYPEYFFYWNYHGQNSMFNTMNYQNPAMDKLIEAARFEPDPQKYTEEVEGFITIAFAEVPRILLFHPFLDVAMQKTSPDTATGFTASSTTGNLPRHERVSEMIVLRRLATSLPSVAGVIIVTFLLTRALPGDPAVYFAGPAATQQAIAEIRHPMGFDRSLPVQFLDYLGISRMAISGTSLTHRTAGADRISDAAAGIGRTDAVRPDALGGDRSCRSASRRRCVPAHWSIMRVGSSPRPACRCRFFSPACCWSMCSITSSGIAPAPLGRLDVYSSPPPHWTGFYLIDSLIAGDFATFRAALAN